MKKSRLELKLESFMAEINRIKNAFISEGREATEGEKQELQTLRDHIRNLEEMKRVIREAQLKSEEYNR